MSYTQLFYHIVLRTKYSIPAINEEYERELYAYIWECVKRRQSVLYQIGGIQDHLHMFLSLFPSIALSDFIREIKVCTSKMMTRNPHFPLFEGWGNGYAALTYSCREKETVINYIKNQKQHHKVESFANEYRRMLVEAGIPINEKYFLID